MQKRALALCVIIAGLIGLTGCSTASRIQDQQGKPIVLIECGASTSVSICYSRAAKECPNGYQTVAEESGFNRKTLKVRCQ